MRKPFKVIGHVAGVFVLYVLIFGAYIFNLPIVIESDISYDVEEMLTPNDVPTYAYVLDEFETSLDSRLTLIENAEESINISYYTIHGGESRDLFFGALLEKADEGVSVNIILDDVFYYQTRDSRVYYEAIMAHDNINFRFYERFNPLLPHTIQNRLHDKLIMVDDTYGIIGGRNIGDRYYHTGPDDYKTHDRDVLIMGDGEAHPTVQAMNAYYHTLFNHDYSYEKNYRNTFRNENARASMREAYVDYREENNITNYFDEVISEEKIAVDNATFVHGPLTRWHKDPVVLDTLVDVASERDEWFIQSPYIAFSPLMRSHLPSEPDADVTLLTNSPAISPNMFAMSGYARVKEPLAEATTLYEYHGTHSLHAKTMMFGGDISVIGSFNLDPRSTTLSTESVMIIYGEDFNHELSNVIDSYLRDSLEVDEAGELVEGDIPARNTPWYQRVAIRIVGLFTRFTEPML